MRICFVSSGTLDHFWEGYEGDADVVCLGFSALGEVNYEAELNGTTSLFEDVAIFSKEYACVVLCGCYTNTRGFKRKSVVVAERGRILGVSDMVNVLDGAFNCGAGWKLYDTSKGKLGVLVAEDLYFPEAVKTFSDCGADLVFCIYGPLQDSTEQILMRGDSFRYGVELCMCASKYVQVSSITGRIAFASADSPAFYEFDKHQEYHLVESRKKGFCRQQYSNR